MNTFITLVGADKQTTKHNEVFKLLFDIAVKRNVLNAFKSFLRKIQLPLRFEDAIKK